MSCPRFFVATLLPRDSSFPAQIVLAEKASAHIRVLRLSEGEGITLFDGNGGEFSATIAAIGKREVTLQLLAHHAVERESPLNITLVQALATGDKMDWIIQKATELGVTVIQPIQTRRATAKLNAERAEKRAAHWQGVAIASCEQCGRNRIPTVAPVADFADWILRKNDATRLLLDPLANTALATLSKKAESIALLIGPEGGFAPDEIAAATHAGVGAVQFGPRVLRTETAGIAAIAVLQATFGDLA